jgi:4-amino-4-deoxy-L-arabinose transferase-like glycosyltransferase
VLSTPASASTLPRPLLLRPGAQALIVLLACAMIYWPRLGADGFFSSEGHRVVPAWAMLDSGDYLVPRLFGQTYLRKPPGIGWAIAGSSAILGRTEFAARAVSAGAMTVGALLSFWYARRWFGALDSRAGLFAGLAHALSPWFWQIGRVAEIEALHQLAVQGAVFILLDLTAAGPARPRMPGALLSGAAGLCVAAMGLTKGPAGAPCVGAALAAAWIVQRSARPVFRPAVLGALLIAAVILAPAFVIVVGAAAGGGDLPVIQSLNEFLWPGSTVSAVLMALPTALGSAIPLSLALLFAWSGYSEDPPAARVARALAWTCLIALAVYLSLGIQNRRYTLPAFSFLAPLVAYALAVVSRGEVHGLPGFLARALCFHRPWVFIGVLAVLAGVWFGIVEPRREVRSGRGAGHRLAAMIAALDPPPTELWADDLVEARPEILAYAASVLDIRGRPLRVRWVRGCWTQPPPAGQVMVLRDDAGSNEVHAFEEAGFGARADLIGADRVHEFAFRLYRIRR